LKIVVLASNNPDFAHAGANEIVLGALLEGLALADNEVCWATAGAPRPLGASARERLVRAGVHHVGDFSDQLEFGPGGAIGLRLRRVREAVLPTERDDLPRFREPARVADAIARQQPDAVLIFWDSWFEHLIPDLRDLRVAGFLAKPRYDASLTRITHGLAGASTRRSVRRWITESILRQQKRRHLARLRKLYAIGEICAVDTASYRAEGLPAEYVPLPVPDFFQDRWTSRWSLTPGNSMSIIGALGTLEALGSTVGLTVMATEVLPAFGERYSAPWDVHIFGRGRLPAVVEALRDGPNLRVRGFVQDIDTEMLRQPLFLFCNNAGPYTGTYTRIPYALSSATCIVAHSRLAESVPELINGENALLGDDSQAIAELLAQAAASSALRKRIGQAARATYERSFTAAAVGARMSRILEKAEARQ
jgi:glycosyltransferase involved in cell wall biosynthesis